MIMGDSKDFEKEEFLLLMMTLLLDKYCKPFETCIPQCKEELQDICELLQSHYSEALSLDDICHYAGVSKSTLLRAFTKSKGMTPYRYLQTIRIDAAKKLLEEGASPVDSAIQTGFSDQSHFTKFFTMFIGLSPGAYREIFRSK